jgi:hypothetical protein
MHASTYCLQDVNKKQAALRRRASSSGWWRRWQYHRSGLENLGIHRAAPYALHRSPQLVSMVQQSPWQRFPIGHQRANEMSVYQREMT